MALFRVSNERAQFDAAGNDARDQYGAGIRFTQGGNARVTTGSPTNYNQGIPMSATGQVAIVDATAGLPAGTIFHNGLPISGDKVCVSRNATAVVSNGTPYDSAGAVAADINLDLNFIGTDTLNSSVTFTRASSATFVGSNGLIQTAATNVPRFDYDPVTLAARGLLIEEQRTNLCLYSSGVGGTGWNTTINGAGVTPVVTTNFSVAPDGTTTASRIQFSLGGGTTTTDQSLVTQALTGTSCRGSFYIKTNDGSSKTVYVRGLNAVSITVDGTWRRYDFDAGTLSTTQFGIGLRGGQSPTNDNTADLLVWGAQLEAGSFATSYIPTVASQVTRSTDVASVNTLSPWFNASEGTLYAEGITSPRTTSAVNLETLVSFSLSLRAGRGANSISMGWFIGSNTFRVFAFTTANATVKTAGGYKSGDNAVVLNGGAPITNTDSDYGTITSLLIGVSAGGTAPFNGHIRRITYYPRRLSNAELQAITA